MIRVSHAATSSVRHLRNLCSVQGLAEKSLTRAAIQVSDGPSGFNKCWYSHIAMSMDWLVTLENAHLKWILDSLGVPLLSCETSMS